MAAFGITAPAHRFAALAQAPASKPPVVDADPKLLTELVAANRVLADLSILDAYGAVSIRHTGKDNRFLMARSLAAELVTVDDILQYDFEGTPLDAAGRASTPERYIHSEIYKVRPDINCIVHCHTPSLIPFGTTKVPLQPLYHMSYFISYGVPVFEIRDVGGMTDTFVRDPKLGKALAQVLGDKPAVLMRGHGGVIVGGSVATAVGRSFYLDINASLQAQTMALGAPINYLTAEEAKKREAPEAYDRAWELWKRKAMSKG